MYISDWRKRVEKSEHKAFASFRWERGKYASRKQELGDEGKGMFQKMSHCHRISVFGYAFHIGRYGTRKFEEPLDIPLELPFFQMYKINYDFQRTVSCF